MSRHLARFASITLVVVALGCERNAPNPLSPTGSAPGASAANADGSILKVSAPTVVSPIDGVKIDTLRPTLVGSSSTGFYVPVVLSYQFELRDAAGGVVSDSTVSPGSGTPEIQIATDLNYEHTYSWRLRGVLDVTAQEVGPWSDVGTFVTPDKPKPPPTATPTPAVGPRRPPGGPLPFVLPLIQQVASQFPGALADSCQPEGGTWDFMDLVLDTIRSKDDTRWGFNWKRGFHQGYSLDVIDYNYGNVPDESSPFVYIIDIINGHCGANPTPGWNDVTEFGPGAWTGRGRF